jgi:hypothetical protein
MAAMSRYSFNIEPYGSMGSLFLRGNPLDAISHWLIENRYFKNRNPKL